MTDTLQDYLERVNRAELGRQLGWSRQMLHAIAKGEAQVPVKRIRDFRDATGLPLHIIRPDLYDAPEQCGEAV